MASLRRKRTECFSGSCPLAKAYLWTMCRTSLPRISSPQSKHPRRTQPRVAELGRDKGIFTHNRYMVSEGQTLSFARRIILDGSASLTGIWLIALGAFHQKSLTGLSLSQLEIV